MDPVTDIHGLLALWERAAGGDPAVRIAVIDGPVDLGHPVLKTARVTPGTRVAGVASSPIRSEHGTHVTSVLMGVPGSPVLGVAPNCSATVYSIYNETAYGAIEPSSQAQLALAINQALADGADFINISSGQQTATGQADRILADAVRRCAHAGTLIIAAAGNDGCRCAQVPGSLHPVLAVGACDLAGRPLPFSNFGDAYLENGILAPGENVKGASPTANIALRSGTSFATPIVTGVAALLLSCLRQTGRDADPQTVRAALLSSARPCESGTGAADERRCLAGRLDIPGAVERLFGKAPDVGHGWRASQTNAGAPGPHTRGDAAELPHFATQPPAAREGIMADTSMMAAPPTPVIFGPDGNALRGAHGIAPSEAATPSPTTSTPSPAAVATDRGIRPPRTIQKSWRVIF